MSEEQLIEVVGRAVVDAEFRALLISEPESAVKEYDLTEDELASLKNIKPEVFESIGSELEERVSRAGLTPGGFLSQTAPTPPPQPGQIGGMASDRASQMHNILQQIMKNIKG